MAAEGGGIRLSSRNRKVIMALAETIIPSEPDRPGALELNLTERLAEWLGGMRGALPAFVFVCWCWEFSPIWSGRWARFSRLSLEERTRILEGWERSRSPARRWALFGLRAIFQAAFYNNPAVWPYIGYEPGCFSELQKT